MGKTEKINKYKEIACHMTSVVMEQINGNLENVDAQELGEVVDIIKDMEEAIMYSEQANYYKKVTDAMDESTEEEKAYYMNVYAPETKLRGGGDEYMNMRKRMHYSSDEEDSDKMWERDPKEGKSPMARKSYMEAREWGEAEDVKKKELEKYMDGLASDITELINGMTAAEKSMLKAKLTSMAGKL